MLCLASVVFKIIGRKALLACISATQRVFDLLAMALLRCTMESLRDVHM